ncbi:MAG: MmgE/PrpD family protein [Beijerinckiaceae bacterium]
MSVLEDFASELVSTGLEDLPEAARERLQLHLLDTLGAWIAGRASSEGRALAADREGPGPVRFDESMVDRIALSIAQTRLTEVDDIHMASCTTPGSVIAPTVLTLAASLGSGRDQVLAALNAGYTATIRAGLAIDGARILYRGIWPTYFAAPFGAAAAASTLFGLGAKACAHALALSLVQISGAAGGPAPGRNPRWLLAGWAAAAGVRSAIAASRGFGGDTSLLDGDWLEATHGLNFNGDKLSGAPGGDILATSMKTACTAKQAASALAAFRKIIADGPGVDAIEKVEVFVPPAYWHMVSRQPPGRLGRIVSARWQCAVAALYPQDLLDIDRTDHGQNPAFLEFLGRIGVEEDPALEAHFPEHYPARVVIGYRNGNKREALVTSAPGDPDAALDTAQIRQKFRTLTTHARGPEFPDAALAVVDSFCSGAGDAASLAALGAN